MFQFDQPHLRVTKPITFNGVSPVIDQESGKVKSKTVHLPLAAEKGLLEQNNRLPDGLKMKIEKIPAAPKQETKIIPPPPVVNDIIEPVKNKGGRPKKIKENA